MAGFARMRCDRCRLGSQPCADIAAKMASMDAHFQTLCESTDAMRAELTKETPQLKNAVESGMLRPFICLVAMGWRQRRSLAMQLGWSLAESEVFGDPHGEAWEILSKGNSGVQDRASQSYEKAAGMDADWDEVLNRVSNSAFGCSRYVKSTDVADPAGKTSRPIKERERQYEERSARLRNPLDPRIRSLEDEVMEKLWCSRMGDVSSQSILACLHPSEEWRGQVAPSERDEMEALLREPQSQELWTRCAKALIVPDTVVRYRILTPCWPQAAPRVWHCEWLRRVLLPLLPTGGRAHRRTRGRRRRHYRGEIAAPRVPGHPLPRLYRRRRPGHAAGRAWPDEASGADGRQLGRGRAPGLDDAEGRPS